MRAAGLVLLAMLTAAGFLFWGPLKPAPGHRPLHINCPPGSHPSPSDKNDVARKLGEARDRSLAARSLTAMHPPAQSQPNAPK